MAVGGRTAPFRKRGVEPGDGSGAWTEQSEFVPRNRDPVKQPVFPFVHNYRLQSIRRAGVGFPAACQHQSSGIPEAVSAAM